MENNIKSFSIKGLFRQLDIEIPFDNNVKILIGDNGLGKTHILNILYYTLTQNIEKLSAYIFKEVTITLKDEQKITIPKEDYRLYEKYSNNELDIDLNLENNYFDDKLFNDIINKIGNDRFQILKNKIAGGASLKVLKKYPEYRQLDKYELNWFYDEYSEYLQYSQKINVDHQTLKKIKELENKFSILYFPTFRRIEEDIKNLGYDEYFAMSKKDDRLIQFGMTDVQERFINYTSEIDKLSKLGFSKISGEILSQLVKGIPKVDEDFLVKINHNDVEIILSRVGDEISKQDKGRIKKILDTKEINEKDHSLLYFLKKLINIYDEQRELDNTIRIFVETCNKYLTDKKVIYDESAIDIYIEKLGERLELSNLSSGEKQIVSIFSKIYLTIDDKKFIILIDEPELSLSVFWQEMLLPDILNSGKCSLLLAATHSPFIYEDNKVEQYAVNLHEYIIERK